MEKFLAGVDIGGTTIKLGLFPMEGKSIASWEIKTRKFEEISHIWEDIAAAIYEKMAELGLEKEQLAAAGMGLPGPICENGYLPWCVNLGMSACVPADELSRVMNGLPVAAGNDANVAALGEVYYGACKGYLDAVMVTLGTGVGAGIISRGKMIAGNRGVGGEMGHFVVNPDETEKCNCGNCGCLEQYASATGIVRMAKKLMAGKETSLSSFENLTCKDVCDEAKKGDPVACETLEYFGRYLGLALSHVILTNDPDVIAIGGGVSKAGQILLDYTNKYVDRYTHIAERRAEIVFAALGNDAGIYGAAALAKSLLEK